MTKRRNRVTQNIYIAPDGHRLRWVLGEDGFVSVSNDEDSLQGLWLGSPLKPITGRVAQSALETFRKEHQVEP